MPESPTRRRFVQFLFSSKTKHRKMDSLRPIFDPKPNRIAQPNRNAVRALYCNRFTGSITPASCFVIVSLRLSLYLRIKWDVRGMVRLSCKRAINNKFSSCPKIKTSQFVVPEGPRDDAFLHYRPSWAVVAQ